MQNRLLQLAALQLGQQTDQPFSAPIVPGIGKGTLDIRPGPFGGFIGWPVAPAPDPLLSPQDRQKLKEDFLREFEQFRQLH